jgi:hypothetical protein
VLTNNKNAVARREALARKIRDSRFVIGVTDGEARRGGDGEPRVSVRGHGGGCARVAKAKPSEEKSNRRGAGKGED